MSEPLFCEFAPILTNRPATKHQQTLKEIEMKFTDAISDFENYPASTDAFVKLKKNMEDLAMEDPDYAAVYLVIYGCSKKHHLYYEDQEVTPETSASAKEQMIEYLTFLREPVSQRDRGSALVALSKISYDYFTQGRVLEP